MLLLLLPVFAHAAETKVVVRKQDGKEISLNVDIARTEEEHAKGLMFRKTMPDDGGMLFIFDDLVPRAFWMKNTLIPLDIIFIGADGRILNIHPGAKPHDLTPLYSAGPVAKALEIKGGRASEMGFKPGDQVLVK